MDFHMVGMVNFLMAFFFFNIEQMGDEKGVAWGGRYFFP